MIEELAVAVKVDNQQVWVEAGGNTACGGCLQKTSCTTNAIGSVLKKKAVPVDCTISLNAGDHVLVAIDENLLLRASLLLYLLPLTALFIGAGLADWLLAYMNLKADAWIAVSGLLCFGMSMWLIHKIQNQMLLNYVARPVVVKKV